MQIEKRREFYGSRTERKARLLDQMELELEDLEAGATEGELAAEQAAARAQTVRARSSASGRCANPSRPTCRANGS